jgi:hypothetical protein
MIHFRGRLTARGSLIAAAVLLLLLAHGMLLRLASSHLVLSGAVLSGLIALVVIKHLGWLGGAYAMLRRHRRSLPK